MAQFPASLRSVLLSPALLGTLSCVAAGLSSGCGVSAVTRGADLYAEGRYVEAAEVLEHNADRLPQYNAEERARYALYRGVTLLSLGDVASASEWLGYSERLSRRNSDVLSNAEHSMLLRARRVLEQSPTLALAAVSSSSSPPPAAYGHTVATSEQLSK